jgi:rod shape-determining protein MreD
MDGNTMSASTIRLQVLGLIFVFIQLTFLGRLQIEGVHPDLLFLVPIAVGLVAGSERAIVVGFAVGMAADLFNETPFGLTALTFSILGYGAGMLDGKTIRAPWWLAGIFALVGSAIGLIMWVLVAVVITDRDLFTSSLLLALLVVSVGNALLAPPVVKMFQWAYAPRDDRLLR